MTKKRVIQFLISAGCTCHYCGHEKTMYVTTAAHDTTEDINLLVVQYFGITPDFELRKH